MAPGSSDGVGRTAGGKGIRFTPSEGGVAEAVHVKKTSDGVLMCRGPVTRDNEVTNDVCKSTPTMAITHERPSVEAGSLVAHTRSTSAPSVVLGADSNSIGARKEHDKESVAGGGKSTPLPSFSLPQFGLSRMKSTLRFMSFVSEGEPPPHEAGHVMSPDLAAVKRSKLLRVHKILSKFLITLH